MVEYCGNLMFAFRRLVCKNGKNAKLAREVWSSWKLFCFKRTKKTILAPFYDHTGEYVTHGTREINYFFQIHSIVIRLDEI